MRSDEKWEEKTIGDFIRLRRGYDLPVAVRRYGSVPVMGSAGQNGVHDAPMAKGPGVVIGRSGVGAMGKVSYCEIDYFPHNTVLYVTDFLGNCERFAYYLLQHVNPRTFGSVSAQASLNRNHLYPVRIKAPAVAEQRAIAMALSDVDGLLGGLDRVIAKKRDLKQAAMQQLLTCQTRLPGFHGEWEVKRLGDVASLSKGTQLHSSEADEGGRFAHLNGGITPSGYTHKSNTAANTIAISEGGNSCGFVQFMREPYWCGGHCYSVIPHGIDNQFLYHALKGQQSAIMALRVGSGLPNVQKTGLLAFKLRLPADLLEQTAIAEVLTDMDAELAALEQRRDKTRALKQAMMQELLTGRTRLLSAGEVHA